MTITDAIQYLAESCARVEFGTNRKPERFDVAVYLGGWWTLRDEEFVEGDPEASLCNLVERIQKRREG